MFRNTHQMLALFCVATGWLGTLAAEAQMPGRQPTRYAARTQAQTQYTTNRLPGVQQAGPQFGFGQQSPGGPGYLPQHLRQTVQPVGFQTEGDVPADAVMGQPVGETMPEPLIMDPMDESVYGEMGTYLEDDGSYFDADCDTCGIGGCDSGQCGTCKECIWTHMGGIFTNADYRVGVHGFKNPLNRDQDGSFGFHGGVNLGTPLSRLSCGLFSGQIGINNVQSNFSGSSFTDQSRSQLFVTTGIFRKVDYGLQGGMVYDYLQDEWYTNIGVSQLRGELSWVYASGNTFGFRFAHGLATDRGNGILMDAGGNTTVVNESWRTNDTYRFFYRKLVHEGEGHIDFTLGYTEEDQTLFGLDFNTPIRGMLRFYGGFTYLLPEQDILARTNSEETWNVMMGVQISPYRRRGYCRYNVPMFDVADNGSMQVFPNN